MAHQGAGKLGADLALLVGGKDIDDAVDGLGASWVCRVAKTRWPVSAAVSAVAIVSASAHLAHQDDVGVLAQDAL